MRIVVAGPPKTGNVWLKCLLASMFALRPLGPKHAPEQPRLDAFRRWVEAGRFGDGTIFHQHYDYSPELADAVDGVPARLVTIVRDPYDAFVSSYFTLQNYAGDETRQTGGRDLLIGKPLAHPDVLEYLRRGGFRNHLVKANAWVDGGRSLIVRYEDLHADAVGTLERVFAHLAPIDRAKIGAAVDACSAEAMRKRGGGKARHVRAARTGDSRDRLNEAHLAAFRDGYADLIRRLGYEVR